MKAFALTVALIVCFVPVSVVAQAEPHRAVGIDVFASTDADHSNVLKLGLTFDFEHADADHYQGVRLETFHFSSSGSPSYHNVRGYYTFAGTGDRWKWNGAVGTDGRDLIGNGSLYTDEAFRQEYFISRDLVETPIGVQRGLYSTYAGAAYDVPLDESDTVTALVGVQKFSGKNYRLVLRGRYTKVVEPEWGLSVQLRSRYFLNSTPREFDYFSPKWYFEAIPTIQIRRFYDRWQYVAAFGWGIREEAGSTIRSATLANVAVISPPIGSDWKLKVDLLYSNTPSSAGYSYNYEQASLSLVKTF